MPSRAPIIKWRPNVFRPDEPAYARIIVTPLNAGSGKITRLLTKWEFDHLTAFLGFPSADRTKGRSWSWGNGILNIEFHVFQWP